MKLTKPNVEKLFITRARLWANVYWSVMDSSKGSGQPTTLFQPDVEADRALKRFDERFGNRYAVVKPEPQTGSGT